MAARFYSHLGMGVKALAITSIEALVAARFYSYQSLFTAIIRCLVSTCLYLCGNGLSNDNGWATTRGSVGGCYFEIAQAITRADTFLLI